MIMRIPFHVLSSQSNMSKSNNNNSSSSSRGSPDLSSSPEWRQQEQPQESPTNQQHQITTEEALNVRRRKHSDLTSSLTTTTSSFSPPAFPSSPPPPPPVSSPNVSEPTRKNYSTPQQRRPSSIPTTPQNDATTPHPLVATASTFSSNSTSFDNADDDSSSSLHHLHYYHHHQSDQQQQRNNYQTITSLMMSMNHHSHDDNNDDDNDDPVPVERVSYARDAALAVAFAPPLPTGGLYGTSTTTTTPSLPLSWSLTSFPYGGGPTPDPHAPPIASYYHPSYYGYHSYPDPYQYYHRPATTYPYVSPTATATTYDDASVSYYQNVDTRKRARRVAAGNLVSGLFGGGGSSNNTVDSKQPVEPPTSQLSPHNGKDTTPAGRKSTAQPRPNIKIPPRGIGPVYDPNPNDVLCGRGGRINAHNGNVQFREMVQDRKKDYLAKETKKLEKAHIAAGIVRQIRDMNPSGRFLKEDPDGSWFDIGDAKAIKKVGQALREDAPDIRHELHGSDEEVDAEGNVTSPTNKDRATALSPAPSSRLSACSPANLSHGSDSPIPTSTTSKHHPPGASFSTSPREAISPREQLWKQQQQQVGNVPHPNQSAVAVSGRGGAKAAAVVSLPLPHRPAPRDVAVNNTAIISSHDNDPSPYQPIAFQQLSPPPTYQPILPPQQQQQQQQHHQHRQQYAAPYPPQRAQQTSYGRQQQFSTGRTVRLGGAFSGAAAAAMSNNEDDDHLFQIPPTRDIAFGRKFHPADAPRRPTVNNDDDDRESSMISGLSGTMLSGMSGISGLTDNISSISGTGAAERLQQQQSNNPYQQYPHHAYRQHHHQNPPRHGINPVSRENQLNQLRQQWAAAQQTSNGNVAGGSRNNVHASLTSDLTMDTSLMQHQSLAVGGGRGDDRPSQQRHAYFDDRAATEVEGRIREEVEESWAAHSARGDTLRNSGIGTFNVDDNASTFSGLSGMQSIMMNNSLASGSLGGVMTLNSYGAGSFARASGLGGGVSTNAYMPAPAAMSQYPGDLLTTATPASYHRRSSRGRSTTNMSVSTGLTGLDSFPSIGCSVMSDISENLLALDLADPLL